MAKAKQDSVFNEDVLLNKEVDTDFAAEYTPVPGGEYVATIDDGKNAIKVTQTVFEDGNSRINCALLWKIDADDKLKQYMKADNVYVTQRFRLNLDEDGNFETGPNKNVALGNLRTIFGKDGIKGWALTLLKGQGPAQISTRVKDGMYAEVKTVTPLEDA